MANYIQSEIWAEKIDLFKAKRGFKKVGIFSFRDVPSVTKVKIFKNCVILFLLPSFI